MFGTFWILQTRLDGRCNGEDKDQELCLIDVDDVRVPIIRVACLRTSECPSSSSSESEMDEAGGSVGGAAEERYTKICLRGKWHKVLTKHVSVIASALTFKELMQYMEY